MLCLAPEPAGRPASEPSCRDLNPCTGIWYRCLFFLAQHALALPFPGSFCQLAGNDESKPICRHVMLVSLIMAATITITQHY